MHNLIQDPVLLSHKVFVCTDQVRRTRHMTLGRAEWAWHLAAHPSHILLNCVAYWADWVGLWQLDNPAFKYLAVLAETLHII